VTKLEGGFIAAWEAGIVEISRYANQAGRITYVDLGQAWKVFPSFPVEGKEAPPSVPASLREIARADLRTISGRAYTKRTSALPTPTPEQLAKVNASAAGDPWSLVRLGADAARGGDHVQAIAYLDAAAEIRKVESAARNNLGNVYTMLGRYDEAVRNYELAARDKRSRRQVLTSGLRTTRPEKASWR
jgi:tetratricopeptide (TPR) repeat protein